MLNHLQDQIYRSAACATMILTCLVMGCQYGPSQNSSNLSSSFFGQTRVPPPATGSYTQTANALNSEARYQGANSGFSTGANGLSPQTSGQLPGAKSPSTSGPSSQQNNDEVWPESFGPRTQSNYQVAPSAPVANVSNPEFHTPVAKVNSPTNQYVESQRRDERAMPATDLTQVSFATPTVNPTNQYQSAVSESASPIASGWITQQTTNAGYLETSDNLKSNVANASVNPSSQDSQSTNPKAAGNQLDENSLRTSASTSPLSWRNPNQR